MMNSKRIFPNRKYKYRKGDIVINWGNSKKPNWYNKNVVMLNSTDAISRAINKLETFRNLTWNGLPTVEWTTNHEEALNWIELDENRVIERHTLFGYGGKGIRVVENSFDLDCSAKLYTRMIENAREYRVHVFKDRVFDIQQKKRRAGQDTDGTIKNKNSGWVFVREITTPPSEIYDIAIKAIRALGLDFGAVDILTKNNKCYIIEVNTAVGLEGTTLLNYTNIFKEYARI